MKALAIKDWEKNFLISQNTRVGRWGKLPVPINLTGERFRILMATPRGRELYAIFLALAAVAANMPKRGILAGEDGPMSEFSLHVKTGIPLKVLSKAIEELKKEPIGWLVEVDWEPPKLGADSERARSTLGALRAHSERTPSALGAHSELAEQSRAKQSEAEQSARADSSAGDLPACLPATAAEALAKCGVGEPMLSRLAPLTTPAEVLEVTRGVRPGRTNPVGVIVGELCRRHGIEPARVRHSPAIAGDVRRASTSLDQMRRLRAAQ